MEMAKAANSTLESLEIISVDRLNAAVNDSFVVCETVQQQIELNNISLNGNDFNSIKKLTKHSHKFVPVAAVARMLSN
jgi:acetolactate synthase small subunit